MHQLEHALKCEQSADFSTYVRCSIYDPVTIPGTALFVNGLPRGDSGLIVMGDPVCPCCRPCVPIVLTSASWAHLRN